MKLPAYFTTLRTFLLLVLLAIVFIAVYQFNNHWQTKKANELVEHTNRMILNSEKLLSDLKDIETGTRGYVLTGDSDFLQPYLKAKDVVIKNVKILESLSSEDKQQLNRIKELDSLSQRRLAICSTIQHKRDLPGFVIGQIDQELHTGKKMMDTIRNIVATIQTEEAATLTERKATLEQNQNNSTQGLVILGASALLLFLALLMANRFFNMLRKTDTAAILQQDTQLLFYKTRIDDILKSIADPLFALDSNHNIVYYNPAFQKTLGHGKGLVTGKNLYEEFPQFKTAAIHQLFIQVKETVQPASFELYEDFQQNWYDVTIYPASDGYSVYIKNASVRKRYEDELKTAMRFLEETNAVGLVGGWELDIMTGRVNWTTETHHIHETDPETFYPDLKNAILFYKPGYSRNTITKVVNEGMQTGATWDCMLQIITSTGREKWVRAMGKPLIKDGEVVKLTGTFQDINDQKILMDRLMESEQRYKSAFENSPDGMTLMDKDLKVLEVNQSLLDITGYSKEEILRTGIGPLTHPDDKAQDEAYQQKISSKEISSWKLKKRYLHKDGHVIHVIASGSVITDKDGNITHYLAQIQEVH